MAIPDTIKSVRDYIVLLMFFLAFSVRAQEDCFNDDPRLMSRNDPEPPSTPVPALTVSDQDISGMLARISEQESRVNESRAQRTVSK